MDSKLLMPVTDLAQLQNADGTTTAIKYKSGSPRSYRIDMRGDMGRLRLDLGEKEMQDLTKRGEKFSLVPVAFRRFKAALFTKTDAEKEVKDWVELFFVNQLGHLSCLLFHKFSVQNFDSLGAELFYADLDLSEALVTISFNERKGKGKGKEGTYFIASFSVKPAPRELVDFQKEAVRGFGIYRSATQVPETLSLEASDNYPIHHVLELQAPQPEDAEYTEVS